jgi:hypothetical protein
MSEDVWTIEMAKAAELLGLDPDDEHHRRSLLEGVRQARATRGRPKGSVYWTDEKLLELGGIVDKLWLEGTRIMRSKAALARKVFKAHPGFQSEEAIRRRLPEAIALDDAYWDHRIADGELDN